MRIICCCIAGSAIISSLIFITRPAECGMKDLFGGGAKMSSGSENINAMTRLTETYMNVIAVNLHYYNLDNGMYPTTEQGLQALVKKPTLPPIPSNWKGPYISKIPLDPSGKPYHYVCPGVHNKNGYDLWSIQYFVNNWDNQK